MLSTPEKSSKLPKKSILKPPKGQLADKSITKTKEKTHLVIVSPTPSLTLTSGQLDQRSADDFTNFKRHFSHSLGCHAELVEEYKVNLQKQSLLLTQENQHLKRKLLEVTQSFPVLETESIANVEKYRELRQKIYDLELENLRRDGLTHYLTEELESLTYQEKVLEDEKRRILSLNGGDQKELKAETEKLEKRDKKLKEEIFSIEKDKAHYSGQTNYLQAKTNWIDKEIETHRKEGEQLQRTLDEKSVEHAALLKQVQVQELCSSDIAQHKYPGGLEVASMRDEIATLRSKVKAAELDVETDRLNRLRHENNRTHLTQENADLLQKLAELVQHLDLEKSLQCHALVRGSEAHNRTYISVKDSVNSLMKVKEELLEELHSWKDSNAVLSKSVNAWETLHFEKASTAPHVSIAKKREAQSATWSLEAEVETLKEQLITFDRLMESKSRQYSQLCKEAQSLEQRYLEQSAAWGDTLAASSVQDFTVSHETQHTSGASHYDQQKQQQRLEASAVAN